MEEAENEKNLKKLPITGRIIDLNQKKIWKKSRERTAYDPPFSISINFSAKRNVLLVEFGKIVFEMSFYPLESNDPIFCIFFD